MGQIEQLGGHASATALVDGDVRITYGELEDRVLRTAAGLRARGLTTGARVAVLASPTIDGVVSYLGVQAAGLLPVMLSPRSPRLELERRFGEVDPALAVLGTRTDAELPEGIGVVRPVGSTATDAEVLAGDAAPPVPRGGDSRAVVLYTSGVAGLPKPVALTYANLAATTKGLLCGPGGLDAATVAYAGLPLSHVFGLNSVVGSVLLGGGKLVLNDGFDPVEVGELVARNRVTSISGVPLQWKALAAVSTRDLFSTVTRATWSAAPMPPLVVVAVEERLGLRLAGGFGLTETSGTICHDDPADPHKGSVGYPLGDTEVRLVDDGEDALPGDFGELWVRGASVVRSYLDGTPSDLTDDGWLRTGDIGVFDDDGRLAIVDRSKDVINVSGFNVSPAEVEEALASHPAVAASVVVGDVDERHDAEIVVAHVVPVPGSHPTESELIDHCRLQLSRYKVPRRIQLHDELPVTESGKAVRRLLGTA